MHPRPRSRLTLEVIGLSKHRSLAALLALLVCLAFLPSPAYAIDIWPNGTIYEEDTDTHHNWFGRADNVYDAAVYAMGHSPNELTDEMRLMLSDPNYGGDFYAYALSFYHVDGWFDIPSFVPTYALGTIGLVQDFDRVYASSRSISSYESAFQGFLRILHGEIPDAGGPSGGTDVSGSFPSSITLDSPFGVYADSSSWSNFKDVSGVQYMRFSNPSSVGSYLSSRGLNHFYVFNAPFHIRGGTKGENSCVLFYASASPIEFDFVVASGSIPYITFKASSQSPIWFSDNNRYGFSTFSHVLSGTCTWPYDGLSLNNVGTSHSFTGVRRNGEFMQYITYCNSNGVGLVLPPSGDWPSDSGVSVPVAPVVPDPDPEPSISGTVVVAPSVTWPDIDITINNNDPENTTPADYTPWLQAINASLNSLRSDLLVEFDAIQQSIRNIYYYLQHLDSILESHCVHIRNQIIDSTNHLELYLRDLVHWLAEQLDYDANVDLDDNAVIAYLTQISSKMGGGTYEPNPISSEDSYYAWLDDLWDRFLLGDNWESSAQSISSSFSQLTTRFPFSIPWDIVALFRLFVHDPVTPVFDLPLFFSSDSYAPVHVDLSGWDGVASMVRPVIYVIFALKLALLSRDLLAGFGADKGGL